MSLSHPLLRAGMPSVLAALALTACDRNSATPPTPKAGMASPSAAGGGDGHPSAPPATGGSMAPASTPAPGPGEGEGAAASSVFFFCC